jgi:thiol-disulfide isomerase/thioredoxin
MNRPCCWWFGALGVVVGLVSLVSACRTTPGGEGDDPSAAAAQAQTKPVADDHLRFLPAPPGDVPSVVQAAVATAHASGRRVIVYEGATWCEPCKNFHAAVAKGELDATFPKLTLLEFDADRDRDRLVAAGYGSQYIPLFALPGKDGRAAGPKASGGIKGDGVVPYLTKKIEDLLAQGS